MVRRIDGRRRHNSPLNTFARNEVENYCTHMTVCEGTNMRRSLRTINRSVQLEDVFGCMRRLRDLLAPAGIVAMETQMTNIASDLPIFECASDTYKTTVQQGKNSLGGVGISNFLLPNDAAIRNLADSFDFACEALDSPRNVYSAELPGRRLYRLVRG